MLTDHSRIVVSEGLTAADLGGEAVVLDPRSGRYFGLNEVGVRVFDLVREPRALPEIVSALRQEFDVDEGQLKRDVLTFLRQMEARRLVEVDNAVAPTA